jgi:heme/copper-type cytochrome/quinol oxidase subunit 2
MKKTILALVVIASLAFGYQYSKPLTVTATEEQWSYHFKNMAQIKDIVNQSNLPHQQVLFVLNSLDSLQNLAYPQLFKQLTDTAKSKK